MFMLNRDHFLQWPGMNHFQASTRKIFCNCGVITSNLSYKQKAVVWLYYIHLIQNKNVTIHIICSTRQWHNLYYSQINIHITVINYKSEWWHFWEWYISCPVLIRKICVPNYNPINWLTSGNIAASVVLSSFCGYSSSKAALNPSIADFNSSDISPLTQWQRNKHKAKQRITSQNHILSFTTKIKELLNNFLPSDLPTNFSFYRFYRCFKRTFIS